MTSSYYLNKSLQSIWMILNRIEGKIDTMAIDYTKIQAAEAANANAVAQAVAAIKNIAGDISAAVKSEDVAAQSTLDGLAAQLDAQTTTLTNAMSASNVVTSVPPVAANT